MTAAPPDVYSPAIEDSSRLVVLERTTAPLTGEQTANNQGTSVLQLEEHGILAHAERDMARGLVLYNWWRKASMTGGPLSFELLAEYRDHRVLGFRSNPPLAGDRPVPVIGFVQEIPFARPKPLPGKEKEAAHWYKRQIQVFTLRYFMNVTKHITPQGYPQLGHPTLPLPLQPLSWCSAHGVLPKGVGFRKEYYRTRSSRLGRFKESDRAVIGDLRELGDKYDWVILKAALFDESLVIDFPGHDSPRLIIPLRSPVYFSLSPKHVLDQENPSPGLLGKFGFVLMLASAWGRTGSVREPSFWDLQFRVHDNGQVVARTVWIGRRPKYRNFSLDNGDFLDAFVADEARMPLNQQDREFLMRRSLKLYGIILGVAQIWSRVSDWEEPQNLNATGFP